MKRPTKIALYVSLIILLLAACAVYLQSEDSLDNPRQQQTKEFNHDFKSIPKFLVGHWSCERAPYIDSLAWSDESYTTWSNDFIKISPNGDCLFRVYDFQYEGKVDYDEAYAGFYTKFEHNDKTHIFIFTPDNRTWNEVDPNRLALAFIGHDSKPLSREIDYEGYFRRTSAARN
jgi:hypothetical protein